MYLSNLFLIEYKNYLIPHVTIHYGLIYSLVQYKLTNMTNYKDKTNIRSELSILYFCPKLKGGARNIICFLPHYYHKGEAGGMSFCPYQEKGPFKKIFLKVAFPTV